MSTAIYASSALRAGLCATRSARPPAGWRQAPLACNSQVGGLQEKETELAAISAQRTRFQDRQADELQEQEHSLREEAAAAKRQLKQLTKDFQYNLQLLKDRDTELELLENQVTAHKATGTTQLEVSNRTWEASPVTCMQMKTRSCTPA